MPSDLAQLLQYPPKRLFLGAATPFECAAKLGDNIWVKREDLIHPLYGGNKVRKLAWLLAEAQTRQATHLLTTGALGSHHVLATALHGQAHGFRVHALWVPQCRSDDAIATCRHALDTGLTFTLVKQKPTVLLSAVRQRDRLQHEGHKPYLIAPGGTQPASALGTIELGFELAHDLRAAGLSNAQIFVPVGSSGTVAGVALGLALANYQAVVHAVRVVDRWLMPEWLTTRTLRRSGKILAKMLRTPIDCTERALASLVFDDQQLGAGYTHPTATAAAAMALAEAADLTLEPTYSAKAMAALLAFATPHPRVFLHTYNSAHLGRPSATLSPQLDEMLYASVS